MALTFQTADRVNGIEDRNKPYLLVADLHGHKWSAYSTVLPNGVNSRLQIILDELDRAVASLKVAGGDCMVVAGDVIHSRGSIDPEVFNPIHARFEGYSKAGINIYAIPGNHDLAGNDTTVLGNAIQTLSAIERFTVVTRPDLYVPIVFVPWCATVQQLREKVLKFKDDRGDVDFYDLVIHVGIDGVLTGMPDHGLTADEIAKWGFRRVFAGHYHHFKAMADNKVFSIGATTHQTWSDLNTKAGFCLVYPDRVEHHASHAPSFVELTGDDDPADYPAIVDGNYVRIRGMKLTDAEVKKFRAEFLDMGAKGVTFQIARESAAVTRAGGVATKGTTLAETVGTYVDTLGAPDPAKIKTMSLDVLSTVQSVAV